MKKLIVLPTWIIVRLTTPLLSKEHVWKNKKFTLTDWAENGTDLTYAFSILLWMNILISSVASFKYFIK